MQTDIFFRFGEGMKLYSTEGRGNSMNLKQQIPKGGRRSELHPAFERKGTSGVYEAKREGVLHLSTEAGVVVAY